MQLAIGLLTASLDSPGLEAWAVDVLPPHDADGLADFMAGLHLVSELLLHELPCPLCLLQRILRDDCEIQRIIQRPAWAIFTVQPVTTRTIFAEQRFEICDVLR